MKTRFASVVVLFVMHNDLEYWTFSAFVLQNLSERSDMLQTRRAEGEERVRVCEREHTHTHTHTERERERERGNNKPANQGTKLPTYQPTNQLITHPREKEKWIGWLAGWLGERERRGVRESEGATKPDQPTNQPTKATNQRGREGERERERTKVRNFNKDLGRWGGIHPGK
jgi:hypothetical protein